MEHDFSEQHSRRKHKSRTRNTVEDQQKNPEDEQKFFVSLAVAFVIKNSCKGLVSLCTSVAELLKDKDKLQKENVELKRQISELRSRLTEQPLLQTNEIPQVKCKVSRDEAKDRPKCVKEGIYRSGQAKKSSEKSLPISECLLAEVLSDPVTRTKPQADQFSAQSSSQDQEQCLCATETEDAGSLWTEASLDKRKVLMPLGELKKLLLLANTYLAQGSLRNGQVTTLKSL